MKIIKKLIGQSEHDKVTVIGRKKGLPLRVLENDMTKKYLQMEREGRDRSELEKYSEKAWKAAVELGDIKEGSFIAGLTVSQIKEIKPVKEILEELMKEYQREMGKIYNEFKQ